MDNQSERWVAVVYDYGEKVGSRNFTGDEDEACIEARLWVKTNFGEDADWSFHHVT